MPEPRDPALDTALRVLQTAVDMPREWDARLTPVQAAAVLREMRRLEEDASVGTMTLGDIKIVTDPTVPRGEVHLRVNGKTVGKIVELSTPAAGIAATPTEGH